MKSNLLEHIDRHYTEIISKETLQDIYSCIDLTNLSNGSTREDMNRLCHTAIGADKNPLGSVAAICIYPIYIPYAVEILKETRIKIATVAGGFPAALTFEKVKMLETAMAIEAGAHEIDVVLSVGKLISGRETEAFEELQAYKKIVGTKTLKVILETGLLQNPEIIKQAGHIALEAGADFIKTSTGKDGSFADLLSVEILCNLLFDFNKLNGIHRGLKIAGGISETHQAIKYAYLIKNILGPEWLAPHTFRIGASKLAENILWSYQQL